MTNAETVAPNFGSERGLFWCESDADRAAGQKDRSGTWKNIDFLRLKDFALHIVDPKPGMTILDLGCSSGSQMVYCGLQGAEVYGQDLDPERVAAANSKLSHFDINGEARAGDVCKLDFPDSMFNVVLSSDFHEHLYRRQQVEALTEARRVLKPGGFLFIKTPNLNYLRLSLNFKRLRALTKLQDPRGFIIPHTPGTADPEHVGLSTRSDVTGVLRDAGFLNSQFFYAPLRRFQRFPAVEILSTEVPFVRDRLCEDVFCQAWKPIALSHFPD